MILIKENNDEYEIRFGYDADIVEHVKNVPGRYWHPEGKYWTIPKARLGFLIAEFKNTPYESQLMIKSTEDFNVNASIDQPNEIPDIDVSDVKWYVAEGYQVYAHQKDTVKFAKWRYLNGLKSGFMLTDQPGTGKTLSVTEWAMYMKEHYNAKHCLIIACVNSAKYNWCSDIEKHTRGEEIPYLLGTRKYKRKEGFRPDTGSKEKYEDLCSLTKYGEEDNPIPYFIVMNIEALQYKENKKFAIVTRLIELVNLGEIDMIVLDEIHRNASMHSVQGRQLLKIKQSITRQIQWLPLTGTPITSRPTDVFLPLRLVDGHMSNNYGNWCREYCVYGGFNDKEVVGYKNIPKLKKLLQPNMLRRLKKDILDLPPKIHNIEYVTNSPYQDKLYKQTAKVIKHDKAAILKSMNPMAKLLKLRQINGSPELVDPSCSIDRPDYLSKNAKLSRLLELLDDILTDPNEKVVIFSNWVEPLRTLYKFITQHYKVCCYTGTMSAETREQHKKAFIDDPERRIMLGTVGALGTSHTLTVARNVIFYDCPWNPADKEQAEDRCHRPGTQDTVFVYTLVTIGTVDEKVNEILSKKEGTAQYIVDDELDLRSHPELFDFLLNE